MYINPFEKHTDRYSIWDMLVKRDIIAFCKGDWALIEDDFIEDGFIGIDSAGKSNPDEWILNFPELEDYKKEWLKQAKAFNGKKWKGDAEKGLYNATILRDIDLHGSSALVHKKFNGELEQVDGTKEYLNWQSLYRCKKISDQWRIQGFTGYLPFPISEDQWILNTIKNKGCTGTN